MKKFIFLFVSLIFISTFCFAQISDESLFKTIMVKGRYGFVNANGEIVIEPQFDLASEFHDGLAQTSIGGEKMANISSSGRDQTISKDCLRILK